MTTLQITRETVAVTCTPGIPDDIISLQIGERDPVPLLDCGATQEENEALWRDALLSSFPSVRYENSGILTYGPEDADAITAIFEELVPPIPTEERPAAKETSGWSVGGPDKIKGWVTVRFDAPAGRTTD